MSILGPFVFLRALRGHVHSATCALKHVGNVFQLSSRQSGLWLALLVLVLGASACAPVVKDGQAAWGGAEKTLEHAQTAGQTFTARDRGLDGVDVFLSPQTPGSGEIRLHLRSGPQAQTDVAESALPLASVTAPGFYHFAFSPQSESRNHDYYLQLDLQGDGAIGVGTASGDAYLDGALYQDGDPVDAQMAFRLAYDPVELAVGLAELSLIWLQTLLVSLLLFILPGWALASVLLSGWTGLSWGERLGLSAGLSIALYPLLMLWTALFGLHLGALYAWLPVVVAIGVIAWRNRAWRPTRIGPAWENWRRSEWVWHDIAFAILLALVFGVRFWVIRSLDVPMWGDSYQHTMIAQLLVDHGGLFDSWEPYADLQTFTYHFGFHAAAAVFHWVSGLGMPQTVLWTGQVLNGLAVLALYPLAVRVSGNRWAGVGVVLVAGLLSPMPMAYVNWGRYTQLAGQVVLPAAVTIAWITLEMPAKSWKLMGLAWIAWGGLALAHYRVLIFALPFFAAFIILVPGKHRIREFAGRTLGMGLGGALLFMPWFLHTFAGRITETFAKQITTPANAVSTFTQEYNTIGDLGTYLPNALWLLFLLSVLWALWRRDKRIVLVSLWWFFVLLLANPQWLRLPGEGALSSFAVFIAAYIPVSIILGASLGSVTWRSDYRVLKPLLLVLVVALGLGGMYLRLRDVHVDQSALATRPDLRASRWIASNLFQATFLVNSFFAYSDTVIVGSDGGWWLPLLANRKTTLPPINYSSEQGPEPSYRQWINALATLVEGKGIADPDAQALLRDRGIDYVYIGQRQGCVNYSGPAYLPPEELLASQEFVPVYHQDRVWVFKRVE